ncbi:MAG: flagellar biosynthetic protein FlhB [Planctomycetaceae bacterium]|nr:flagellar biosynthetic protein FlhB [Planctomycetaceae bacterium]
MESDDRTAPPTERRRRQAREQGLGPRSQDLGLACRLIGIAAALQFCGSSLVIAIADMLLVSFTQPIGNRLSQETALASFFNVAASVATQLALFVSWILVSSVIARLVQVGFRVDFSDVIPDFKRISPTSGMHKLLQMENGYLALINGGKFLLLLGAGSWFVWSHLGQLAALLEEDVSDGCRLSGSMLLALTWQLALVQLLIGVLDYGWRYWKFEQSLKMTLEELKQEAGS